MSDTPSTQATRPADNGAKKNFVWQAQDIKHLVDTIYINKSYQCAILPSHHNEANEPANKLCVMGMDAREASVMGKDAREAG